MSKQKPIIQIESYGLYSKWNRNSKDLPAIKEFTVNIPAVEDNEFGYILHIKKGKGLKIHFSINHPNITDEKGQIMPPFTGEVFINSNDFRFYIGDCIWAPVENKTGNWEIVTLLNNSCIASKTFNVYLP